MWQNSATPKVVVSAGPGMATSAWDEDPAYVVTTDVATDYGFSLTRFRGENAIHLMVEDQTHCPARKSQLTAKLHRDRLVVGVAPEVVTGLNLPTDYVVLFSAPDELLSEMDATLRVICDGIATYSCEL
jgi:hypothetical protein